MVARSETAANGGNEMICDTCKHMQRDEDEWPCKWCAPDTRRYERDEDHGEATAGRCRSGAEVTQGGRKAEPDNYDEGVAAVHAVGRRNDGTGRPGAHYPEEWGPSDNRRLTCVCGDPDPFHATKTY